MGATKTDYYTDKQLRVAKIAKALGHPARVAIIDYLISTDACICGDIVDALNLSQSTISQHLRELKEAGIIKGSVEGASICYCIDHENLEILANYLGHKTKC
jgi:DNA-binding transcriptional ArsR family regulator